MTVAVSIVGGGQPGVPLREAHIHRKGVHAGQLAFVQDFLDFNSAIKPFLNPTNGTAMNKNVTFGGTPEIIHNGGTSTEWTASAVTGTGWNFADGGTISVTSANDQDEATFAEQTPTTVDLSGFVALTGTISLTTYNEANNSIEIFFDNAGTQVGDTLDLEDFIDTNLIGTTQNYAIALTEFNFPTDLVDGFSIRIGRSGGSRPTMVFDDITLENTGDPLVYTSQPGLQERFHVEAIRFTLVDNVTNIVTVAGATENATLPGLSYNQILGVSALTNGLLFQRTQDGDVNLTLTLKQLSDFFALGFNILNPVSDGTNTVINLEIAFPRPFILDGKKGDNMTVTVSDNLSGLLLLVAAARGTIEIASAT